MSITQPLITIVIPTYKRAEHFERAIRSVLEQPGNFWELLLGDDGSPDATPDVIARYASDPRVHTYRNIVNLGMQENLIKIVRMASGRYVFILTDDDYMLPGALEKTRHLIDANPDAGYFLSHLPTIDERSGQVVHWHRTFKQNTVLPASLQNMAQSVGSAWVLSRQVLRYDLIDWETWEKFKMNIFFPIITAGRVLLKAPMVYLAEPLVMHTQFNQVFWDKFGANELEIQFNLDRDAHRCMRAILHDYPTTPEIQQTIEHWETGNFATYLYRADKGFYDLVCSLGMKPSLVKLNDAFHPTKRQWLELVRWLLLLPALRLWHSSKKQLSYFLAPALNIVRRRKAGDIPV